MRSAHAGAGGVAVCSVVFGADGGSGCDHELSNGASALVLTAVASSGDFSITVFDASGAQLWSERCSVHDGADCSGTSTQSGFETRGLRSVGPLFVFDGLAQMQVPPGGRLSVFAGPGTGTLEVAVA